MKISRGMRSRNRYHQKNIQPHHERIGVVFRLWAGTDAEVDVNANLDIVGVNDPLLFIVRSSRLEDLVGETEVEIVGLKSFELNVGNGRRGERPERNSSISEADWVRGRKSTEDSSRKVPCPVKKQNLKEGEKK